LAGKIAVITGAARGIGKETALTFSQQGASLALADINEEGLSLVAQEIAALGGEVLAERVDVSQSAEVKRFVDLVLEKYGALDILVNSAVYLRYEKFLQFEEHEWDRVMAVSLKGCFLCGQAAAREMIKRHGGKIINMASIAGEVAFPKAVAYGSSKAGVIGLTRVMALELAEYGINVNAIAPGPTDTELLRSILDEQGEKERTSQIPLSRFGTTRDMANAALFLACDESAYITGHVLHVDGGFLASGWVPGH